MIFLQRNKVPTDKSFSSTPHPINGLQIEKPVSNTILCTQKSTIQKSIFNPSVCDAQYYNIVEDLAQESCVMSTLEVLQTCPT